MDPVHIPAYIDDPPPVLMWTVDEIAPIGLGLVVGMFTGNALILTSLGLVLTHFYRRFRDGRPDGVIWHFLYWWGFTPTSSRTMPNPFIREFLS